MSKNFNLQERVEAISIWVESNRDVSARDYVDNVYPKVTTKITQLVKDALEHCTPERKPRPESGPNKNGNSEGVRKAYNRAIDEIEARKRELLGEIK